MHPSKSWRRTALAAALLASTALTGVALAQPGPVNPPAMATPAILPDFSGLVAQVKPAVVSITTTISESQAEGPGVPIPLPFPFSQMIPRGGSGVHEARGSGFIIRQDGLIVTNYHVVKDGSAVSVTLDDGRELKAKVIGTDPRTDIAIVKVDAGKPLPFIQLGDSRDVRPGEWVVAMGNPFGLGGTVTAGIVSAVSRDIGSGPYDQFIQVDAPINQGNSGGPLFTQEGKVIGMNSAIFSPTGGSVGIGFAIPSNMIRTVSDKLAATGHVTRGFEASGALLASVASGSPAAKAGLEPGDVVESVNGQKITSPRDLAVTVASVTPGEEAKFQILRDGQDRDIEVKVGEQPPEKTAHAQPDEPSARGQLGLALGSLTPDVRDQLNVPDGTQGALVRSVRSGSPADEAGLRPGDVIVGVGNQKVSSPSDATKAIAAAITAKSHAVALRVLRDGEVAFVGVTVGEAAG
jgi:serine protease Do